MKKMSDEFSDKILEAFSIDEKVDHKMLWFSMFESIEEFAKAIFNKEWFLGYSENKFYTSDNPVVLQNTANKSTIRGTLGLDSYGIEIYLPLTSSLILCLFCEKMMEQFNGKFSIEKFQDQSVLNVNALQYFQSERFIFSNKNNFEMIEKEIDI